MTNTTSILIPEDTATNDIGQPARAAAAALTEAINLTVCFRVQCPNTGTDTCDDGDGCPAC